MSGPWLYRESVSLGELPPVPEPVGSSPNVSTVVHKFPFGFVQLANFMPVTAEPGESVWADAKIVGNRVVVSSEKVQRPVAVRYAWADNPEGANLANKDGLPASPFRTDDHIETRRGTIKK